MAKQDNNEAAKLELIAQLLSSQAQQKAEEPKKKKKSKCSGKTVGDVVSKSSKSKAQKQKAGEAELRREMAKPRTEPINPKK